LAIAGGFAYFAFQPEDSELARPVKRSPKKASAGTHSVREPVTAVVPVIAPEKTQSHKVGGGGKAESTSLAAGAELAVPDLPKDDTAPVSEPFPASGKVTRYSKRLLEKYDRDHSGSLEGAEWSAIPVEMQHADNNRDDLLTLEELTRWVADYGRSRRTLLVVESDCRSPRHRSPVPNDHAAAGKNPETTDKAAPPARRNRKFTVPQSRLPQGLPDWFLDQDSDGDGQLTLSEFATAGDSAQKDEFAKLDLNNDGIVTAAEYVRAASTKPAAKPAASAEKTSK
jgi:hypothetical protein